MAYPDNGPQPTTGSTPSKQPKDNRKFIYGALIIALLGTWGYLIYDKNKSNTSVNTLQTQYTSVDSSRNAVQAEYNDALARMDSLTGSNVQLKGQLADRAKEIDGLKSQISAELGKKNADLSKARSLIAELRGKVNDLLAEVDRLRAENQQLTASNSQLSTEKDTLTHRNTRLGQDLATTTAEKAHITDEASTLHASGFNITALNVKTNGKEKTTEKAKKANVLRISFFLDENRIAPSGEKDLYLIVKAPDGNVVTIPNGGSGTFNTRQEGNIAYTSKIDVNYEQGTRLPVSYDWHQNGKYQVGNYTISIFHNGYKIGEGTKTLKKSGFLGL